MSEGKFSKCEEGEMFKYRISGVRKKMKERRKKKVLGRRCLGGIFAKFVFTGLGFMLICKLKLQKKNGNFQSILRFNI